MPGHRRRAALRSVAEANGLELAAVPGRPSPGPDLGLGFASAVPAAAPVPLSARGLDGALRPPRAIAARCRGRPRCRIAGIGGQTWTGPRAHHVLGSGSDRRCRDSSGSRRAWREHCSGAGRRRGRAHRSRSQHPALPVRAGMDDPASVSAHHHRSGHPRGRVDSRYRRLRIERFHLFTCLTAPVVRRNGVLPIPSPEEASRAVHRTSAVMRKIATQVRMIPSGPYPAATAVKGTANASARNRRTVRPRRSRWRGLTSCSRASTWASITRSTRSRKDAAISDSFSGPSSRLAPRAARNSIPSSSVETEARSRVINDERRFRFIFRAFIGPPASGASTWISQMIPAPLSYPSPRGFGRQSRYLVKPDGAILSGMRYDLTRQLTTEHTRGNVRRRDRT
ncbi:hypothetical protein NITHO_4040005 [Nitrolancea hollandica Lb]|uniref:Uncharacterized protein n=1 Tax=Nitrolancea hollandica Lb TaxID=1129897 RepID=I4EJH7_9BACT|nr:hypothetical protein NITHO_4040005 [Nitrolancea hollandica Lb]